MTYTCAMCNGEFEEGWSDEEAIKEYEELFGETYDKSNTEVVCDDCFNKMNGLYPIAQFVEDTK